MIYPIFAMFILTFLVGVFTLRARVNSVKSGRVSAKLYKLMDGDFPDHVVATTRCFNNQFELPVLFYVVALAYMVLGLANSPVIIALAWLFVLLRAIHAVIHITYNHLLHRVIAYWLGFLVIAALWVHLLIFYAH